MDIQFPFSPLFFSACILFFLILLILTRLFRTFNSVDSSKNLPPQPWKLPLVGHLHHLLGAPPHHALRNIAQKYGPIVGLQLGQISMVIISSPPFAKGIMKTHDISFANRPKILTGEIVGYNYKIMAFSPYGDYWRQMRKISVIELLSAKKVIQFQSIREQVSWDLIEFVATHRLKTINLSKRIYILSNTIITSISVGSKCKDQVLLVKLIQECVKRSSGFDICDLYPSITILPLVTGTRNKMVKLHNKLDKILDNIILEHKQLHVDGTSDHNDEEDLMDVLLRLKDDGGLEFPLNVDNIKAIILEMFIAGSDTSSVIIEWAMSELMKNPRVMKKAQDELRQVLKGKTKIHESDIQELQYLKLVIKETLRLHPPVPLLVPRECRENSEVEGFHIPVKTKVVINMWMLGRDPNYWIDPESFIPERFIDSSINFMGTNFEYIPFGAGRRMCPGMNLGLANVELPLAMLLYHFDWELPNGPPFKDFDMVESFGATLKRKNDLILWGVTF